MGGEQGKLEEIMSMISRGIAPRRTRNGMGYMSTRHVLEDLKKLLEGGDVDQKRAEFVIDRMLEFAKKTCLGFKEFDRQSSKDTLMWDHETLCLIRYAKHLERHLGSRKRAEQFARSLKVALEGYQNAAAAYDTPRFIFSSAKVRLEVLNILKKLINDCNLFLYVFPDLQDSVIVWKR